MRIAYFLTHPIQYQSPLIRHLRAAGVDVEAIYATDACSRVHLLAVNELSSTTPDLDAISAAGQHWYRPHNRENTAAAFAKLLLGT